MVTYRLYYYRYLLFSIMFSLNLLTFHDCLNRLPLLYHLWLLHFLCRCSAGFFSAFSCCGSIMLLHKLSVGFAPLLTWCGLTSLSGVLRFYTSCILALLRYWLCWLCFVVGLVWTCYVIVLCATILHKLSVGFALLLTWCRLDMLLSHGLIYLYIVFLNPCSIVC